MTTALAKTNGEVLNVVPLDGKILESLVLDGDLAKLNSDQRVAYYNYRCKAMGLDPATKPFDLLALNGKLRMYATRECAAQIENRDKLTCQIVSSAQMGDVYVVTARAQSPDGRFTDDIGAVAIKGLAGDNLCNALMKAATKAKRRAILGHAGLGMLDESEIETIPAAARTAPSAPAPQLSAVAEQVADQMQKPPTQAVPRAANAFKSPPGDVAAAAAHVKAQAEARTTPPGIAIVRKVYVNKAWDPKPTKTGGMNYGFGFGDADTKEKFSASTFSDRVATFIAHLVDDKKVHKLFFTQNGKYWNIADDQDGMEKELPNEPEEPPMDGEEPQF